MAPAAPIPLEETSAAVGRELRPIGAAGDARPRVPEPPPVALVSVTDVRLASVAGREHLLDRFYVDLLRFERDHDAGGPFDLVYKAENHDLRFRIVETPPARDDCRPLGVLTPLFREIVEQLETMRYPFDRVRGLVAGEDALLLQDPAGNWLAVAAMREVR